MLTDAVGAAGASPLRRSRWTFVILNPPTSSLDPSAFSAVQPVGGSGKIGISLAGSTTSGIKLGSFCARTPAAAKPSNRVRAQAAVFIRVSYSIDFASMLCQEAIHDTSGATGDYHVDPGRGGSIDLHQSTLHRRLELAAKRCRRDRPKLFSGLFSFCASANRLGRGYARLCRH